MMATERELEEELAQVRDRLAAAQAALAIARNNEEAYRTEVEDLKAVILGHWRPQVEQAQAARARLAEMLAAWVRLVEREQGKHPNRHPQLACLTVFADSELVTGSREVLADAPGPGAGCSPAERSCVRCTAYGRHWYGVERLTIDDEQPCSCPCHTGPGAGEA